MYINSINKCLRCTITDTVMGMYNKVSDCLVLQNDSLVSQDETLVSGEGGNLLLGSKCYTVM